MSEMNALSPRCHLPWQEMIIQADGSVEPCCYWTAHGNNNKPLGNVNINTIEEIWNDEGYRNLRKNMACGDLDAAGCSNCYALKQGMKMSLEYDAEADTDSYSNSPYSQNINILKKEIAIGADTLSAKPTIVSVTASHKCNLSCTHCYQNSSRSRSWTRENIFEEIEALTPTLVRLIAGGGEPLLLNRWRKFISNFKIEKAPLLNFAMTTNATIIIPEVLEGLKKFNSLHIIVSMDGANTEYYNKIRVNGDFETVRKNIFILKDLVESRPANSVSTFGMCMSLMKSNINHLPDFIKWAAEEGLSFSVHPVLSLPFTESLSAISNPRDVMGWRESLNDAQDIILSIEGESLPQIWRNAQKVRRIDAGKVWPFLNALESFIPWDINSIHHEHITGSIPSAFTNDAVTINSTSRKLIVFSQNNHHKSSATNYYSILDGRNFDLYLPFGVYQSIIVDEFDSSSYIYIGLFSVMPSGSGFNIDTKEFETIYKSLTQSL